MIVTNLLAKSRRPTRVRLGILLRRINCGIATTFIANFVAQQLLSIEFLILTESWRHHTNKAPLHASVCMTFHNGPLFQNADPTVLGVIAQARSSLCLYSNSVTATKAMQEIPAGTLAGWLKRRRRSSAVTTVTDLPWLCEAVKENASLVSSLVVETAQRYSGTCLGHICFFF